MHTNRQKVPPKLLIFSVMTIMLCSLFSWTVFASSEAKIKKLSVSNSTVEIQEGNVVIVSAKVTTTKKAAPNQLKVKIKSSNPGVAEVKIVSIPGKKTKTGTSKIKIAGKKKGSCKITITAAANNKKGKRLTKTISVTVNKASNNSSNSNSASNSGNSNSNISDMKISSGRPNDNILSMNRNGGAAVEYYFTLKVGNYSGIASFKLTIGSMTAEKNFEVFANKTHELIIRVGFTGYQIRPAVRNPFDMKITMPDGTVKSFSQNENGTVSSLEFIACAPLLE